MGEKHRTVGYRGGCRCTECVRKHRVLASNRYYAQRAELLELRRFREDRLARELADQQAAEQPQ